MSHSDPPSAGYLLEENHDLPLCRVQVTMRSGASSDISEEGHDAERGTGCGVIGATNFATELMRRGAGGMSRAALDEAVDALGASLQVLCWHDQVVFEVMALRENIDAACGLLADVLLRPEFSVDEGERLRRELQASLDDMRDDDGSLMHRFFGRELYGNHPYGRPVAGTAESMEQLSVEQARNWHRNHLTSGNVLFGAAGDLTASELTDLLGRHFSGIPAGPRRDAELKTAQAPVGRRLVIVDKPERTQSQIVLGHLAPAWRSPDFLPLYVATNAFGGTFTARLMDEVRSKRGLSYGASARLSTGRGARALYAHVFPSAEQTPETLELVLRLYEEWATAGLRPGELEFSRGYLQNSHAFTIQTPEDRLSLRTRLLLCNMSQDMVHGFPAQVGAVTAEDVRRAMSANLHPQDLLITLVATAKTILPQLQRIPALAGVPIEVVPFDSY